MRVECGFVLEAKRLVIEEDYVWVLYSLDTDMAFVYGFQQVTLPRTIDSGQNNQIRNLYWIELVDRKVVRFELQSQSHWWPSA